MHTYIHTHNSPSPRGGDILYSEAMEMRRSSSLRAAISALAFSNSMNTSMYACVNTWIKGY